MAQFGTLFEFIRNGMNIKQDKSGKGLPITRIETIWNSAIDPERVGFADLDEADARGWLLSAGDILFSHINSVEHIGKCAIYEGQPSRLVHGMNLLCLRPNSERLIPSYAKHLIRSPMFRAKLSSYINKAVNQASVSIGNLKAIEVRVGSLSEQHRVAAILDKADSLRAKRFEASAQLQRLGHAMFAEMFSDASASGSTTNTLEEVTELITKGTTPTTLGMPFSESGVPFIRVQNLVDGVVDWRRDTLFIDGRTHDALERSKIRGGDVLVSIAGTIGRAALVPARAPTMNCNQAVAIVRPNTRHLLPEFLRFWLADKEAQVQIRGGMVTGTITNASLALIRSLKIRLPSMQRQAEFVQKLSAVERIGLEFKAACSLQEACFNALRHQAFAGEL
nr:restriction endonuclease subunit S [Ramlibacter alkalitolerans]